ncbi:MAG: hypothetical protein Q9184_006010, partial [Pyrenodesmia sp. 2 TL-2023]
MPLLSASSQPSSSAKKQQSISTFFGKAATPIPSSEAFQTRPTETADESLFVPLNEDASTSLSPATPRSKTPKRGHGDVEESVETHSRKKVRTLTGNDELQTDSPSISPATHLAPTAANGEKRPQTSERTSQYTFSSSPSRDVENLDEATRKIKERLHQKFVKKLGRPD